MELPSPSPSLLQLHLNYLLFLDLFKLPRDNQREPVTYLASHLLTTKGTALPQAPALLCSPEAEEQWTTWTGLFPPPWGGPVILWHFSQQSTLLSLWSIYLPAASTAYSLELGKHSVLLSQESERHGWLWSSCLYTCHLIWNPPVSRDLYSPRIFAFFLGTVESKVIKQLEGMVENGGRGSWWALVRGPADLLLGQWDASQNTAIPLGVAVRIWGSNQSHVENIWKAPHLHQAHTGAFSWHHSLNYLIIISLTGLGVRRNQERTQNI